MQSRNNDIPDVLVIGGGPGGAATARLLAAAGHRVQVLEADARARYKTCAGGICPRNEEISPPDARLPVERRIDSVMLAGAKRSTVAKAPATIGYTVWRSEYDQWLRNLAEEAGAEIIHEAPVEKVRIDEDAAVALANGTEYRAKVLVGAFGIGGKSGLLRQLGVETPPHLVAAAAELQVTEKQIDERIGSAIESYVDASANPAGSMWIFPKRDVINIGILALPKTVSCKTALTTFMESNVIVKDKIEGYKLLGYVRGHRIPMRVCKKTYGDRFVLIGDAGGFADAFTGEGIYHAQRTGQIAARVVSRALGEGDVSARSLARYERAWYDEMYRDELEYGYRMADLFFGFEHVDDLVDNLIPLVERDKVLQGTLIAMMAGTESRRALFNRLMLRSSPLLLGMRAKSVPLVAHMAKVMFGYSRLGKRLAPQPDLPSAPPSFEMGRRLLSGALTKRFWAQRAA